MTTEQHGSKTERIADPLNIACKWCSTVPGDGDSACADRDTALQCAWLRGPERIRAIEAQLRYLESCNQHLRQKEIGDLRSELSRLLNEGGDSKKGRSKCGATRCDELGCFGYCDEATPSPLAPVEAGRGEHEALECLEAYREHLSEETCYNLCEKTHEAQGCASGTCALEQSKIKVARAIAALSQGNGEAVGLDEDVVDDAYAKWAHANPSNRVGGPNALHAFKAGVSFGLRHTRRSRGALRLRQRGQ